MDGNFNENDISRVVEADRAHIWHHLSQHKPYETTDPRIIVEGRGMKVWDQKGKEHINAVSGGVWTVNVGYGRERIADAVGAAVVHEVDLVGGGAEVSEEALLDGGQRQLEVVVADDHGEAVSAGHQLTQRVEDRGAGSGHGV